MRRDRWTAGQWSRVVRKAVLGIVLLAAAGCATTGARLDRSRQAFDDFMNGNVRPGYSYYTTGVENDPDAIIGISPDYTLKSERWKKRDITPELLRQLVGTMNTTYAAQTAGLLGSDILNDEGQALGIWYSAVGLTVIEMLGGNEVRVTPPVRREIERAKGSMRGK